MSRRSRILCKTTLAPLSHAEHDRGVRKGFFPGLGGNLCEDVVLSPWVFSEIVALVQAYMLSHMPRYWTGTTPDVMLLREVREE